uniref:Uncharacterized protein n=1 Tax=Castor canadensis TaxID=51338 RepID=A0A8C0W7J5_CASCN
MTSGAVMVNAVGLANEAPEIPDNMGDCLQDIYYFATDNNDSRETSSSIWNSLLLEFEPTICDHHEIMPRCDGNRDLR